MAVLLFRLNGVPDDEADDVRELLSAHQIDYYETQAGRWRISVAAIWLKNDAQLALALRLIDEYQRERERHAREAYAAARREGRHERLIDRVQQEPLRVLLYAALIVGILYLTIMPFISSW